MLGQSAFYSKLQPCDSCKGDLIPCTDCCTYMLQTDCKHKLHTAILYILNLFITSIISLIQAQILLLIKRCHDQRYKVSSLPLLLFTELMKLIVLYATAHLKATLVIHARKGSV